MTDTDEQTRRIHCNSGRVGFLNTSNAWGAYCSNNGDWTTDFIGYAGNSFRAPVFYDSNNTAYYVDPASTSNVNVITAAGTIGFTTALYGNSKTVITTGDSYLRLNQDNSFTNGTYTPYNFRADGVIYVGGTSYYITSGTSNLNTLTVGNINGRSSAQLFYYQGFTLDANTMDSNASGFTYAVNAPYTGPIARLSETGYSLQFNAAYSGGGTGIAFRTRNGDAGTFNPWRVLLNDANYTSYSPSLTGSGASGTWGISISGNAATATSATSSTSATFLNSGNYINRIGGSGNYNTDFQNTPAGSVRHQGDDAGSTNNPGGTWWFVDNYRHSNSSNYWGIQVAWGWEDNANRLATRNVTGGTFGSWVYYMNTNSYPYAAAMNQYVGTSNDPTFNRVYGTTDIRTPIFYDNNNTAYYGDFASTSNLNVLAVQRAYAGYDAGSTGSFSCSNWFRSSGATGWYNESYTGGIYMIDSTYVRTYNTKQFYVDNAILGTIFYDVNNTGYYCDPASTSNLNAITCISLTETSSKRYKENIVDLHNSLDKVLSMRGVAYNRKGSADVEIGLIAEEVAEIVPEIINFTEDGQADSVSYGRVTALLIEAIKEQQKQIDRLTKLLNNK
jgi:hypothetical protein